MKHLVRSTLLVLALGVGLSGCMNDAMGPDVNPPVEPEFGLLSNVVGGLLGTVRTTVTTLVEVVNMLLGAVVRLDPPETETVVERWVGSQGGVLRGGGVELHIPKGALSRYTKLTLTVPASKYVEVQLQPHGLKFDRPAELRFDVSGTSLRNGGKNSAVGAFFTEQIVNGVIEAEEVFPATLDRNVVRFKIDHFSWYAPARRGYTPAGG